MSRESTLIERANRSMTTAKASLSISLGTSVLTAEFIRRAANGEELSGLAAVGSVVVAVISADGALNQAQRSGEFRNEHELTKNASDTAVSQTPLGPPTS